MGHTACLVPASSTVCACDVHAVCTRCAWCVHGVCMVRAWCVHGVCMRRACGVHGVSMACVHGAARASSSSASAPTHTKQVPWLEMTPSARASSTITWLGLGLRSGLGLARDDAVR